MLAYKGFNSDLTCTLGKGKFQFTEGEWIEEKRANCRASGFHAAENPLDCLFYYPDWDRSVYYLVEVSGDLDEDGCDSKIAGTRIRLLERLSMRGFVEAAVDYVCRHPERVIPKRAHGKIRVSSESGSAPEGGAVIVYGDRPRASGQMGSIIALIKTRGSRIESVCIREIDGNRCKADTWYQI